MFLDILQELWKQFEHAFENIEDALMVRVWSSVAYLQR